MDDTWPGHNIHHDPYIIYIFRYLFLVEEGTEWKEKTRENKEFDTKFFNALSS